MSAAGRLAVALAGIVFALPATAQTLQVEVARIGIPAKAPQIRGGLHGGVDNLDAWLPFEAILSNPGSHAFSGALTLVELGPSARAPLHYARSLTLAPGARKRVAFPVLCDASASYTLRFDDDALGTIPLRTGAKRTSVRLPHWRNPLEKLVLVASRPDDRGRLDPLQPRPRDTSRVSQLREWILAAVDPTDLPTSGLLYHRVDALVLDDVSLDRLTTPQQHAIVEFVAQGGLLWVSMLRRVPGAESPLAAALPGTPTKARELRVARAFEAFGTPSQLLRGKSFLPFVPAPGAVPWDEETPVVVHGRHERGWIILAGCRFTELPVAKPIAFLRELLLVREQSPVTVASSYNAGLRRALPTALRQTTKKSVPPLLAVLGLLGVYMLCVAVIPFAALRPSRRLEWAWVGVAVMALGGTAAVFELGHAYEQPSQAVRVSLVEGGARPGRHLRTSHWSIFSRSGGALPLAFEGRSIAPFPFDRTTGAISWDGAGTISLETHPQDATLLLTNEPCELPGGLRFTLSDTQRGKLENTGPAKLFGAWAWDAQGEALALDLPARIEPLAGEDALAFDPSLAVAKTWAKGIALQRQRPMALYIYAGQTALSDLPERALDLGLLEAEGWGGVPLTELAFAARKVGETRDTTEWAFSVTLPPGMVPSRLSVQWRERTYWGRQRAVQPNAVNYYDWTTKGWDRLDKAAGRRVVAHGEDTALDPGKVVQVSPLGVASGRFRLDGLGMVEPHLRLSLRTKRGAR